MFHRGWFWPLAGLLFAPWTTLFYVLVYAPVGPTGSEVGSWYGRGFWLVVIAEAVLLIGGLRLMGAPSQTSVAWVAFVVGVHVNDNVMVKVRAPKNTTAAAVLAALLSASAWHPIDQGSPHK